MAAHPNSAQTPLPSVERSEQMDDATLLREARQVLEERLGVVGLLRFLALVSGGRDRFEDIRRQWEDISMEEAFQLPGTQRPAAE